MTISIALSVATYSQDGLRTPCQIQLSSTMYGTPIRMMTNHKCLAVASFLWVPSCYRSAVRQSLGFHVFHPFQFSAFLFNSVYDASFRNSFSIHNQFHL